MTRTKKKKKKARTRRTKDQGHLEAFPVFICDENGPNAVLLRVKYGRNPSPAMVMTMTMTKKRKDLGLYTLYNVQCINCSVLYNVTKHLIAQHHNPLLLLLFFYR